MGIKEEIFEVFFSALEGEKEVPELTVRELKQLKECGEVISEAKLLGLIERGCQDANENKED